LHHIQNFIHTYLVICISNKRSSKSMIFFQYSFSFGVYLPIRTIYIYICGLLFQLARNIKKKSNSACSTSITLSISSHYKIIRSRHDTATQLCSGYVSTVYSNIHSAAPNCIPGAMNTYMGYISGQWETINSIFYVIKKTMSMLVI
jgi:phage-related protein